ncbi:MAG: hypothetical protein NVS3B3_24450 [Aquirhabdus sp.]
MYNQQYHEPEMTGRLDQALATNGLLRLKNISFSFPANADQAYLAYAQSWNLLSYMYSTFGQPEMQRLIKDMNNPQNDFDQDLTQALGLDENHLENQWRLYLHQSAVLTPDQATPTAQVKQKPRVQVSSSSDDRSRILIALGGGLVVISLAGFIILFAGLSRRRKQAVPVIGPPNGQPVYYHDPANYMRASMYAQPGAQGPPDVPTQEYSSPPPRRQYPQE